MIILPVSLIITHYNQYAYLISLLEYAKENNWFCCPDIIVVDDCSLELDELANLTYLYKNVVFLQTKKNSGPSAARNLGVSKAKENYIQFLDADDWIHPEKIAIQYQYVKDLEFPSFLFSNWSRVSNSATPVAYEVIFNYKTNGEAIDFSEIITNFFPIMSGLINKEAFFSVNGLNEEMTLIEDVNFLLRLYNRYKDFYFLNLEKPMFFYRTNVTNSLSSSNPIIFYQNSLLNYKLAQEYTSIIEDDKSNFQRKTFIVLWHLFLFFLRHKNTPEFSEVMRMINEHNYKNNAPIQGKKYLVCKILGFKLAAKILPFIK